MSDDVWADIIDEYTERHPLHLRMSARRAAGIEKHGHPLHRARPAEVEAIAARLERQLLDAGAYFEALGATSARHRCLGLVLALEEALRPDGAVTQAMSRLPVRERVKRL